VGGVGVKLLADFLKGGHPRDSKMTVLKDHPCALFLPLFNHPECNGTLALPEGKGTQLCSTKTLKEVLSVHACGWACLGGGGGVRERHNGLVYTVILPARKH